MRKYTDVFHLNSVPSMIESRNEKYIVFSHCQSTDKGPTLYFYDVNQCKEVKQIKGGEALIDYHEHISLDSGKGRLMMLGNKEIMGDD